MISPNQDDFWGALKPVIFVSQLFSLFPVQGVFAKDASGIQFRWMSLRTLYALFFPNAGRAGDLRSGQFHCRN